MDTPLGARRPHEALHLTGRRLHQERGGGGLRQRQVGHVGVRTHRLDREAESLLLAIRGHRKCEEAFSNGITYYAFFFQNHDGRLNSGHYTSFIRNLHSGEWLKFDDDICSRINASAVNVSVCIRKK